MCKSLLADYARQANASVRYEARLAEQSHVRAAISALTQQLYGLEALLYYTVGHMDEDETRVMDLECLIVQRVAVDLLHSMILCSARVYGSAATVALGQSRFDRLLKDATTLRALYVDDDFLVNGVGLGALAAWTEGHAEYLAKMRADAGTSYWARIANRWRVDLAANASLRLKHELFNKMHPSLTVGALAGLM